MLEKPDLQDIKIMECLQTEYGLSKVQVTFLPLGADRYTAVYRATADDGIPYFVKLRRDDFDEVAVLLPKLLRDLGVTQVIAPLTTRSGQLWTDVDGFKLILSPFVAGHSGFEVALTDQHWLEFGRALKAVHTAVLPAAVTGRIQQEVYSPRWRDIVRGFQAQVETTTFADPVATALATFLSAQRDTISGLVSRAHQLATALRTQSLEFIVCHADIHVGNVLIDAHDRLYIVDWDTLTRAPKERDLMFVGGGLGGGSHTPTQEETLFYQGYGQTEINPVALAYYRCERIVQDIAAYCEQILLTQGESADRQEGLQQVMSQFEPGAVVELAFASVKNLPPEVQFL